MKNNFRLIFLLTILFLQNIIQAQTPTVQDCLGAILICDSVYYQPNSYVGTGNYPNEIPTGGGCPGNCMLNGERNCVWYRINTQQTGLLGFELIPNQPSDDYDWVVYNLTEARCEDIFSQADELQVSCNWSATQGSTGPNGNYMQNCGGAADSPFNMLIPVNAGETYVINISNWSSTQYGYILDLSCSGITLTDTTSPFIAEVDTLDVSIGDESLSISFNELVACNSVIPQDFQLEGPDGMHTVNIVTGEACQIGAEFEREYVLEFFPPISVMGYYTLILIENNSIQDGCLNMAEEQEIMFGVGFCPVDDSFILKKIGVIE